MHLGKALVRRLNEGNSPLFDVLLALSCALVSLLLGHERPPVGWRPMDCTGYLLTGLVNLLVTMRRRAPVLTCVAVCCGWVCYIAAGYWPVVNSVGALVAIYSVATNRSARATVSCAALAGAVWIYAGRAGRQDSVSTVIAQAVLWPAVICYFGRVTRLSAQRNVQLSRLTERLREEQQERARRAVAEERVRIARELHDVVAHHMSVISVQSGLARYVFGSEPDTARGALDTIAATSHEALQEMRRLLAVLRLGPEDADERQPETAFAPAPGLDRLDELLDRVRTAGVPVECRTTGTPRTLTPAEELCVFRIVQEALTNVIKHAQPARASVTMEFEPHLLKVTVTDDGRPRPGHPDAAPGHGLIGMRERARIYGGTLTAGPRPTGGFQVTLTLPTAAAPPSAEV
ncbi:sensor histidine kinase [Streptantibioticus rubrisoli]|uniref:histidine kinase n=1 Tax=Streptantibioticus rubrisoli TaxID=1387313 RepID=A0ABT1PGP0_9ACTN|nr:sensor histidine kinase [Streptantibioticus rubrisoli]MCQ4043966.1 sensor histidine kinase [Streptantibioticus rubrisoli]